VVDAIIEMIEKLNPKLNAFITILDESARREAMHADSLIKQGKYLGPLHGIPISLKDLIYIKGVRSTSGLHSNTSASLSNLGAPPIIFAVQQLFLRIY